MNRASLRQTTLAIFLAIPALWSGCNRHAPSGKPTALDKSGPEDRYQRIIESFRRKIDGQPVGFVVVQNGTRTSMSGTNKVTSELIPPTTSDGHYKAIVTVSSESHYSLRRTKSAEEAEREQNAKNQPNSALDDPQNKKGVAILEPDLAGANRTDNASQTSPKPAAPDEDVVTRRPDEEIRKYELVDDGQHWALVTKLDPKTEQSIQFAFDEALTRQ